MPKYRAIDPINHDLKQYMPGDEVLLTVDQADVLGAIVTFVSDDVETKVESKKDKAAV